RPPPIPAWCVAHLADAARSTHLLQFHDIGTKIADDDGTDHHFKCSCQVDGYRWEIRVVYPPYYSLVETEYVVEGLPEDYLVEGYVVPLQLVFLGEAGANKVPAALSCRLLDPSGATGPSREKGTAAASFQHPSDRSELLTIRTTFYRAKSIVVYVKNGCLTLECTVTVLRDLNPIIAVPSNNLPRHLGELLASGAGADVTFAVAGQSFPAHRSILAARSPVFMAQFFAGEMLERISPRVEIKEMDPFVFQAMLRFVYTDAVPELDEAAETAAALARHLLAAADRYGMLSIQWLQHGLDRLRAMCERRLAWAIDAGTAAPTLAFAERHGCSELKARCIEFIAGGLAENLDAVLATEGFGRCLEDTGPSVVIELLKAAHARKIKN
ncbi:hypothetical protein PVAP13_2KG289400, partial [Panicum virgatum]